MKSSNLQTKKLWLKIGEKPWNHWYRSMVCDMQEKYMNSSLLGKETEETEVY